MRGDAGAAGRNEILAYLERGVLIGQVGDYGATVRNLLRLWCT